MIRLVSKVGLIVEFRMSTEAAERDLVSKFNLQEVNPDVKLNLGRYGKILVKDIYGMSRVNGPVEVVPPKVETDTIFNSMFNGDDPFKWLNK